MREIKKKEREGEKEQEKTDCLKEKGGVDERGEDKSPEDEWEKDTERERRYKVYKTAKKNKIILKGYSLMFLFLLEFIY